MATKNDINGMSKRQILESLYHEQNQSTVTLSRLITSVARAAGVDPKKLGELFTEDKDNQDYVEEFNNSVKATHTTKHAEAKDDQAAISGEEPAAEKPAETEEKKEEKAEESTKKEAK